MNSQQLKQRFGIIGNSELLNHAIETAIRVASTDLSVLITGESGTGKEIMPQIIHQLSNRKHGSYIAVNCGAIPEGTIDSELFGHEKGSFTGAHSDRKGYFEVADKGTIFLDEVAELPIQTQARLLRVLESGEFIRVGSSKVIKTDVRIVAATNVNIPEAIQSGKFREDLYYRLNTVPIRVPALRERKEDIHLLFRKFAHDFAEKYRMPTVRLMPDAIELLMAYPWQGNVRQLKNIAEQISVIETEREIDKETLVKYLPEAKIPRVPQLNSSKKQEDFSEREILYKVLWEMRAEIAEIKKMLMQAYGGFSTSAGTASAYSSFFGNENTPLLPASTQSPINPSHFTEKQENKDAFEEHEEVEESLSLEDKEKEMIKKALEKYRGKRKYAAQELGISERTLYRKIKEYNIN